MFNNSYREKYVGEIHRINPAYHGYAMTEPADIKKFIESVPIDVYNKSFLDVGCGKGICLGFACEAGYATVAGIDADPFLIEIARNNMGKKRKDVLCILSCAEEFEEYSEYDVFYFFNPFEERIFQEVATKIKESQEVRNREIWILYYCPEHGDVFEQNGFQYVKEVADTKDADVARYYRLCRI